MTLPTSHIFRVTEEVPEVMSEVVDQLEVEKLPWNLMTVQRWFGKSSRRSSRSALQGSHQNDVCSDRSARRSDVRRSDPAEGTRGTLSPSEGCQQQGCLGRLF